MENKLEKIGQNSFMDNFVKTDDILKDMCGIIESSQKAAYRAVNTTLIQRNWLLGYRIASEELQGEDRAKYGALKFSRHRLENLLGYCLGRIMQHYYRLKIRQLATGMRKKPQNRLGVSVPCRGIFLLSIITVCWGLRKKSL